MKLSGEKFQKYLNEVLTHCPAGFEDSIRDEGLSHCVTSYCAVAFMRDGDPKICAETLMNKLGDEEE